MNIIGNKMNIIGNKKIAICYSGQMRNTRMVLDTHIQNLIIPLIENNYTLDLYLYSDKYNTTRQTVINNKTNLTKQLYNFYKFYKILLKMLHFISKKILNLQNQNFKTSKSPGVVTRR